MARLEMVDNLEIVLKKMVIYLEDQSAIMSHTVFCEKQKNASLLDEVNEDINQPPPPQPITEQSLPSEWTAVENTLINFIVSQMRKVSLVGCFENCPFFCFNLTFELPAIVFISLSCLCLWTEHKINGRCSVLRISSLQHLLPHPAKEKEQDINASVVAIF